MMDQKNDNLSVSRTRRRVPVRLGQIASHRDDAKSAKGRGMNEEVKKTEYFTAKCAT